MSSVTSPLVVDAYTKRFAVVGQPIAHSRSPEIFAAQVRALLTRPDARPVLDQIRCPALLLTGQEDGWSPPAQHAAT